ncbi:Putative DNA-binding domain protein [Candidatus Norongarragalina meridionalis]|nr:Putative DNA-binding domain protein [Candidatus Norongarragalina meridionalis]
MDIDFPLFEKITGIRPNGYLITDKEIAPFLNSVFKETINYDFKEQTTTSFSNLDLGEVISAFVNSQHGGLLFVGFTDPDEKNQNSPKPSWIDSRDSKLTSSALRNRITDSTLLACDFSILEIEKSEDKPMKAYAVEISRSSQVPCMDLKQKKYFRRLEGRNEALDHSQVVSLFSQKIEPNLRIVLKIKSYSYSNAESAYYLSAIVKNAGVVTAENPVCRLNFYLGEEYIRSRPAKVDSDFFQVGYSDDVYSRPLGFDLHPGDEQVVGKVEIVIPRGECPVIQVDATLHAKNTVPKSASYLITRLNPSDLGLVIQDVGGFTI